MKTYEPNKEEKTWVKWLLVAILIAGATIIITLFLTSGKPVMHHMYEEIDNSNI
jgi:cytochrome c-type biogenesis protein CcmH/NrfF